MFVNFDLIKSLDELEGCDWREPEYNSGLIIKVHLCNLKYRSALLVEEP